MANRPIDDFDPRAPHEEAPHDEPHEPIDDEADFGGSHKPGARTGQHAGDDLHDDADFVDDDMNDIVDDADPLADDDYDDQAAHDDNDHDEESDDAAPPPPPSRFSIGSLIFYVIIAGVVAGGGYMAYRTFMMGGEPVSPGNILQAAGNATEKAAGVIVPTDNNAPTPAPTPADNSAPVPNPNPVPVEANNSWQTTLPQEPAVAPQAQAQMQPVTQPAVPAVAPAAAVPTTPAGAVAAPLAATVANTEAMAGINARLAETETRLAQMTAKVAQLEQRPAATTSVVTSPPAISAGDFVAIREENSSLQKQITQLNRAQQELLVKLQSAPHSTAPVVATAAPVFMASPKTAAAPAMAAPKPIASSKIAAPKAATPKMVSKPAAAMAPMGNDESDVEAQEAPKSPKTRSPVAATGKSTWVLRAATPGMAWVSPQPGSAELKRVVPGDQLPGVGQVIAIRQDGGRWIVEGSNGTIR